MFSIRKAQEYDIPSIRLFMNALNTYRSESFSPENANFHERTEPYPFLQASDIAQSIFFVATDEGKIIGFIQGSIHVRGKHTLKHLWYIDELFVSDSHRWQWVAKELLSALEEEFRQQQCDHMTTHTDAENNLSQNFYRQSGMNPVTIELWKQL